MQEKRRRINHGYHGWEEVIAEIRSVGGPGIHTWVGVAEKRLMYQVGRRERHATGFTQAP